MKRRGGEDDDTDEQVKEKVKLKKILFDNGDELKNYLVNATDLNIVRILELTREYGLNQDDILAAIWKRQSEHFDIVNTFDVELYNHGFRRPVTMLNKLIGWRFAYRVLLPIYKNKMSKVPQFGLEDVYFCYYKGYLHFSKKLGGKFGVQYEDSELPRFAYKVEVDKQEAKLLIYMIFCYLSTIITNVRIKDFTVESKFLEKHDFERLLTGHKLNF